MQNYKIIKRIGEGSQAVASLAVDLRTNKQVVIKRLPSGARTRDEMNLRVKHPNIIESIETFVADDFAYFVTKYAEGGDLETYFNTLREKQQQIPASRLFSWIGQMCRAVKACHDARIIHRDIKPSNIFLSVDGSRLYLGDFGTAKQFQGAVDVATTFVGSPVCLSPEVISGTPYSFMADVWSLGCVFYEMIALRKPFDTSNFAALVVRICAGKYDPLPTTTPPVLASVVSGMLCTDVNERWLLTDVLSRSEFFTDSPLTSSGNNNNNAHRNSGQPQQQQPQAGGIKRTAAVEAAKDYTSADFGDWVNAKLRDVASMEKYLAQHRVTDEIVLQRVDSAQQAKAAVRGGASPQTDVALNPDRARRMIPSPRKSSAPNGGAAGAGFRTPPGQRGGGDAPALLPSNQPMLFERRPVSEEPNAKQGLVRRPAGGGVQNAMDNPIEVAMPKGKRPSPEQRAVAPPPPQQPAPATAQPLSRAQAPPVPQPSKIVPEPPSAPSPTAAKVAAAAPQQRQDIKAMIREQRAKAAQNQNNGDGGVAVEILLPSNLRHLPQNKV